MTVETAPVYELYALMRLKERYGKRYPSEALRMIAKNMGYEVHQLDMIFDVMLDRTVKEDNRFRHWKEPIHCEIPIECIPIAMVACTFFHGPSNPKWELKCDKAIITDEGYKC